MNTFTQYSQANNAALEVLTGLHGDRNITGVHIAKQSLQSICEQHREQLSPLFDAYLEATLSFRQDKFPEALEQYETLLGEIHRPEEQVLYPYVCIYIATIRNEQGQRRLSQHYFTLAEQRLETQDHKLLLFLNVNLSGILLQLEEWEKAQNFSQKALDIGEAADNYTAYAMAMMNHALALTKLSHFEQAKQHLDKCQVYCQEKELVHSLAYNQLYLAIWYQGQGRAKQAHQHFTQGFKQVKQHGDSLLKREFIESYSDFLFEQKQYHAVIQLCTQILSGSLYSEKAEGRVKLYTLLSESYRKQGDAQQENYYLRQLQKLQTLEIERHKKYEVDYIKKATWFSEQQSQTHQSLLIQDRLDVLSELGQLITSTNVSKQELLAIFASLKTLLPVSSFSLAYYEPETNELEYRFLLEEGVFHEPFTVSCDGVSRLGVYCAKNRETIRLNSASQEEINQYIDVEYQQGNVWSVTDEEDIPQALSVIYTPVVYQEQLLAVISVQFNRSNEYSLVHERIVEQLANYLAVAISHNRQKQELANHNDYLELIYHTDHLTGIKNRHGFDQWLKQQYLLASPPSSAFVLALDGLKAFNDQYSREVGDDALVECAKLIQESLPSGIQLFRYHSDQFLVIGEFDEHAIAVELARSLQVNLKNYFSLTYGSTTEDTVLTSTVGVVSLAGMPDRQACEERVAKIESTIYRVKQNRHDGVFELQQ